MKRAVLASLLLAATASADVTIMDNKKTVTIDCAKDKTVNLVGNHITVTLNGRCTKVTATGNHGTVRGSVTMAHVIGNHNNLQLDGVDAISVVGNDNTLSYKTALAKKRTSVSNAGKRNKISQAK